MAYNEFSLDAVKQQFGLQTLERSGVFAATTPLPVSDFLRRSPSVTSCADPRQ